MTHESLTPSSRPVIESHKNVLGAPLARFSRVDGGAASIASSVPKEGVQPQASPTGAPRVDIDGNQHVAQPGRPPISQPSPALRTDRGSALTGLGLPDRFPPAARAGLALPLVPQGERSAGQMRIRAVPAAPLEPAETIQRAQQPATPEIRPPHILIGGQAVIIENHDTPADRVRVRVRVAEPPAHHADATDASSSDDASSSHVVTTGSTVESSLPARPPMPVNPTARTPLAAPVALPVHQPVERHANRETEGALSMGGARVRVQTHPDHQHIREAPRETTPAASPAGEQREGPALWPQASASRDRGDTAASASTRSATGPDGSRATPQTAAPTDHGQRRSIPEVREQGHTVVVSRDIVLPPAQAEPAQVARPTERRETELPAADTLTPDATPQASQRGRPAVARGATDSGKDAQQSGDQTTTGQEGTDATTPAAGGKGRGGGKKPPTDGEAGRDGPLGEEPEESNNPERIQSESGRGKGGIQHPGATEVPHIDLKKWGLDPNSLSNFTTQMRGLLHLHILPLLENRRDIDVLSVGCGMMLEADAYLREFTGGKYFGLDIDDHRNIARMVGAIKRRDESTGRINFSRENAASVNTNSPGALMNRQWKLIFGRNIQFTGSQDNKTTAAQILDHSISALDSGGVLLLTYFSDVDSRLGRESLKQYEEKGKIRVVENGFIQNPDPTYHVPMQDSYFTISVKI